MRTGRFTADDEEPKCERCESVNASDEICARLCGPEHGWSGYCRTETETDKQDKKVFCGKSFSF